MTVTPVIVILCCILWSGSTAASGITRSNDLQRKARNSTAQCLLSDASLCSGHLFHQPTFTSVSFGGLSNCTQPCTGVYFTADQQNFLKYWTIGCSALCLASCIIVLLVYVTHYMEIRHPEVPVFYITICYFAISFVNLLSQLVDKKDLICHANVVNSYNESAVVIDALQVPLCAVLFSVLYYFTVASWSWWLMITIEWLVTVVHRKSIHWKWQIVIHLVGWGLPLPLLLASLLVHAASGDSMLQLCWITPQIEDGIYVLLFILVPLTLIGCVCCLLLLFGFGISLYCSNTKRQRVHRDNVPLTLLCRASLFSVMFLVIQSVLLICYSYEYFQHGHWEAFYLQPILHSINPSCQQPQQTSTSVPQFPVVVVRVAFSIGSGICLLFWTLRSKLCCCKHKNKVVTLRLSYSTGDVSRCSREYSLTNYSDGI